MEIESSLVQALRLDVARLVADNELATARREAENELAAARRKVVEANTLIMRERGKLNMRGLIEFAEAEFEKNESFKNAKVAEEAERRIKHQQIHGDGWKKEQGPEVVSRIDKWEMVLDLPEYADFANKIGAACVGVAVKTSFKALIKSMNKLIHCDPMREVLDPSSDVCVVILEPSIGKVGSAIVICIAEHWGVKYHLVN